MKCISLRRLNFHAALMLTSKASKYCFLYPEGRCCIWMHFWGHFESISSVSPSAFYFDCQVFFWTKVEELYTLMKTKKQRKGETCWEFHLVICFAQYLSSWPQTRCINRSTPQRRSSRKKYYREKRRRWLKCQGSPKVQHKKARFSWLASRRLIVPTKSIPRHIAVARLMQDPPEVLEPINHLSHTCHEKSKIFHYVIVLFLLSVTDFFWCCNSLQWFYNDTSW